MKRILTAISATAISAALITPAQAQDFTANVKARQGQFRIIALNLGVLGGMARGKADYDAAAAQAAADSIAGVAMVHQPTLFATGSDNMSIDGTRALPEIWDDPDGFASKWADLVAASGVLQTAAGQGKDALAPAVGGLGGTCKACHQTYRAPEN